MQALLGNLLVPHRAVLPRNFVPLLTHSRRILPAVAWPCG